MIITRVLKLVFFRPRRAWLYSRIAIWTIVLSCLVRFRPLPAALRELSGVPDRDRERHPFAGEELATAVDALLGINLFIFRPVCWKRAILLHRLLGRHGCPSTVVFGVRTDGGELKGHAWLESNGTPIYEKQPPEYTVTYRFPSDEACGVDLRQMPFELPSPNVNESIRR